MRENSLAPSFSNPYARYKLLDTTLPQPTNRRRAGKMSDSVRLLCSDSKTTWRTTSRPKPICGVACRLLPYESSSSNGFDTFDLVLTSHLSSITLPETSDRPETPALEEHLPPVQDRHTVFRRPNCVIQRAG